MGFVDRGGGRENKGGSLRRSTKNPGAAASRKKQQHKVLSTPAAREAPPLLPAWEPYRNALLQQQHREGEEHQDETSEQAVLRLSAEVAAAQQREPSRLGVNVYVDGAVSLLTRKLGDETENIIRRAKRSGELVALLAWSSELQRQPQLLELCRTNNNNVVEQQQQQQQQAKKGGAGGKGKNVRFAGEAAAAAADAPECDSAENDFHLYTLLGVHVNNIDRTNSAAQAQWLADLRSDGKHSSVLGVLTGLDRSRAAQTHYAQEAMLTQCWQVAAELRLPLVLHLYTSSSGTGGHAAGDDRAAAEDEVDPAVQTAERAAEMLTELLQQQQPEDGGAAAKAPVAVVLYNALPVLAVSPALRQLFQAHRPPASLQLVARKAEGAAARDVPFYAMVTADGIAAHGADDAAVHADYLALLRPSAPSQPAVVALSQLLLATGSPWSVPQNIEDEGIRAMPNEPSNYPYVARAVLAALQADAHSAVTTEKQLLDLTLLNFLSVFFAETLAEEEEEGGEEAEGEEGEAASTPPPQHANNAYLAGATAEDKELQELLLQAAREREALEQEAREEEDKPKDDDDGHKKKKEKKKNVKANNRSNFTHFRNKNFAPKGSKINNLLEAEHSGDDSQDDEDSSGEPHPPHHPKPQAGAGGSNSSDDEDAQAQQPTFLTNKKKKKKSKQKGQPAAAAAAGGEDDSEEEREEGKPPQRTKLDSEDEDSNDDIMKLTSDQKRNQKKKSKRQKQMEKQQQQDD